MAATEKFKILRTINRVYESARGSELSQKFTDMSATDIKVLQKYFALSEQETLTLTLVIGLYYESNYAIGVNEIAKHVKCSAIKILEFKEHFNGLLKVGILKKLLGNHPRHRRRTIPSFGFEQYLINESLTKSLLDEKELEKPKDENYTEIIDLLEKFNFLIDQKEESCIPTNYLLEESNKLIKSHTHFLLIKKIAKWNLSDFEALFLLNLMWRTIIGEDTIDLNYSIDSIIDKSSERINYIQEFLAGRSSLVKEELVDIVESEFINNAEIRLSETSLSLLMKEGVELYGAGKKKKKNIIEPSNIAAKKLFFNNSTQSQVHLLEQAINHTNLTKIQKRLKEKHLPIGINVLLYGYPGTGKTELVYQLARKTEREIIHLDISQTKSMWFGESEKLIKKVFTDYTNYLPKCDKAPILLFNEADAVISVRKDNSGSGTSQTENAIQNIILEELEKFEGLFFATTNLVRNLDIAFERRFLYKIEFEKPETNVKAKIWKSKLKELSDKDCHTISASYDLTGGQIDNIVRKREMSEIINGTKTDLKTLLEYCKQEQLSKDGKEKIGFKTLQE